MHRSHTTNIEAEFPSPRLAYLAKQWEKFQCIRLKSIVHARRAIHQRQSEDAAPIQIIQLVQYPWGHFGSQLTFLIAVLV